MDSSSSIDSDSSSGSSNVSRHSSGSERDVLAGDQPTPARGDRIAVAGMWANRLAILVQVEVKPLAVTAHPADLARGNSNHERKIRHVAVYDGARADECMLSDGDAANDRAVCPESRASSHERVAVLVLARDRGSRVVHIREHHAGSAEDIVLERYVVVYRDIVLYLDVVPDEHSISHVDILAQ